MGQGNVQVHYNDWQPKKWGETELHIPTDENIRFTVINKDQMESSLCQWERA